MSLPSNVAVFIPSYRRLDSLKKCIESLRRQGYPTGPIHVIANETLDPKISWPNVHIYRIQREGWNEGRAFAACMVIANHVEPFYKYLLIIDDDVRFRTPDWLNLPVMMDYPEYQKVYVATACGDMIPFMGSRLVDQLNRDGICDTSVSCGVLIVRRNAVEEAGLFAPAPCRVEYEYKLRLALIGKVFACFRLSGFRHYRAETGGTNRLFPRRESRVGAKRREFWLFMKRWTQFWNMRSEFVCMRENILAKADNRFQVNINWGRIARFRRGSVARDWTDNIIAKLKRGSRYWYRYHDWFFVEAAGLFNRPASPSPSGSASESSSSAVHTRAADAAPPLAGKGRKVVRKAPKRAATRPGRP